MWLFTLKFISINFFSVLETNDSFPYVLLIIYFQNPGKGTAVETL